MYKTIIWCEDCTDVDPLGCFDGGIYELDEEFKTKEEAEQAAYDFIDGCGPWRFYINRSCDKYAYKENVS